MEIIRAREEHTRQIVEVWQEFIHHNKKVEPLWDDESNSVSDFKSHLEEQIKSDNTLVLVAVEQERVAGLCIAVIGNQPPVFKLLEWGTITDLAVKKEYRRNGIGEKLLTEAINWFAEKNIALVEVAVLAKNQVAASFWKKHGFQNFSCRMYRLTSISDRQ